MDLQQFLQFGNAIPELGKQLIQRCIKVGNLGLMPVINCDAAPDMDRTLSAHQQAETFAEATPVSELIKRTPGVSWKP